MGSKKKIGKIKLSDIFTPGKVVEKTMAPLQEIALKQEVAAEQKIAADADADKKELERPRGLATTVLGGSISTDGSVLKKKKLLGE